MIVALIGLRLLADAALTTHDDIDPDTQMEVVVSGRIRPDGGYTLAEGIDNLVGFCSLEVAGSSIVIPPESIGDQKFRFVFQPALDQADQRQFRGCFHDMTVDHMIGSIESITLLSS